MEQIIHYSTRLDTFGGMLEDGTKAVCMAITDKEKNCIDCYALPPDIAEDLGNELIRIAKKLMT